MDQNQSTFGQDELPSSPSRGATGGDTRDGEQNLDGTAILQEPLGSLLLLIDQEDVNTIHYEATREGTTPALTKKPSEDHTNSAECKTRLYSVDKAAIKTLKETNYEYSGSESNPELELEDKVFTSIPESSQKKKKKKEKEKSSGAEKIVYSDYTGICAGQCWRGIAPGQAEWGMVPYLCGRRNKTLELKEIALPLSLPLDKLHITLNMGTFRDYIDDYFDVMDNEDLAKIDSGRELRYSACIGFLIDKVTELHNNSCKVNHKLIMRNEPRVCSVYRNRMLDLTIVEKYSSGGEKKEIYRVLFEFKVTLSGEAKLNKPKDLKALAQLIQGANLAHLNEKWHNEILLILATDKRWYLFILSQDSQQYYLEMEKVYSAAVGNTPESYQPIVDKLFNFLKIYSCGLEQ